MCQSAINSSARVRFAFFVLLLVVTSPVRANGDPSAGALPAELNNTLRAHAAVGGPSLVQLEVPSAGILSVSVAAPGAWAAEPGLALADRAGGRQVLERSASHLVISAPGPSSFLFRVSAQDPRRPLSDFKLTSGFVPDDFTKDENEDEIEIDASRYVDPDACLPTKDENEDEIEIDASRYGDPGACFPTDDGENEDEIEIDANPLAAPAGGRSLHAKLDRLCRLGEVDDHGDSFPCATFLSAGQALAGEIYNGWGDDADLFHFVLGDPGGADLWTVEIETGGGVDTAGRLYDRTGQRLDHADGGGRSDNFRIVRTLSPGAYYVRVEGRHGAEGLYALRVKASP